MAPIKKTKYYKLLSRHSLGQAYRKKTWRWSVSLPTIVQDTTWM